MKIANVYVAPEGHGHIVVENNGGGTTYKFNDVAPRTREEIESLRGAPCYIVGSLIFHDNQVLGRFTESFDRKIITFREVQKPVEDLATP